MSLGFGMRFMLGGSARNAPPLAGATLVAMFDARRTSTVTTVSGKVTNIASTVGSFAAAATGATSTRPTWNANSASFGGPSFSFDGVDDFLKVSGINTGVQTLVVMTLKPLTWVASAYIFSATGVKSTLYQNGAEPAYNIYNGSVGNTTNVTTGTAKRLWAYFNGTSSEVKGGSIRNAGVDTGPGTGADLSLGSSGGTANFSSYETDLIAIYAAPSMPSMSGFDAWIATRNGASFLT